MSMYVLCGRFIDGKTVDPTFDETMHAPWIWSEVSDSPAQSVSSTVAVHSDSSQSDSASSPAMSVSSSGDGLSSPPVRSPSTSARSLSRVINDAVSSDRRDAKAVGRSQVCVRTHIRTPDTYAHKHTQSFCPASV